MSDKKFARISPEAGLLLGAGRAILLQLAHPSISRAVAEHSNFTNNPLFRLTHTLMFVYALSNGDEAQRQKIIAHVNAAHRPVHAPRDKSTGQPAYCAFDPQLQLWVAATLYDSARVIGAKVLPNFDEFDDEQLYQQYVVLGSALQMPQQFWPVDQAEFETYFHATLQSLEVTAQARDLAQQLFTGANAPWWIRLLLPAARIVTIAELPATLREGYGYRLTPQIVRWHRVILGITRVGTRGLPRCIRYAPMRVLLRRLAKHGV